jgi:hypothetical protein
MKTTSRIVLQETKDVQNLTRRIAEASEAEPVEILAQVDILNDRLKSLFDRETDPIAVSVSGTWRIDGVAGLLRLNSRVELEVVPKFLDPRGSDWRADFFLLAVLVKTGHLLVADEIAAGIEDRGDLATLVACGLLKMHEENRRRPIRGYRRMTRADFSMDGDVDWDTLHLPEPDGYRLQRLELTPQNSYNSILKGAVAALVPEVGEGDTRAQLHRLSRQLGPQAAPPRKPSRLPQRHQPWLQAYTLSLLVLEGLGLDFEEGGEFFGPGFVLSTWEAWQSLCEEVVRRALPGRRVVGLHPFVLGTRDDIDVLARPDIAVMAGSDATFLLDAKYKARHLRKPTINSADLYESLAFLRAARTHRMLLLYPATQEIEELPLGEWRVFDEVQADGLVITGAGVQSRGLAGRGGFDQLVAGMRTGLLEFEGSLAVPLSRPDPSAART